MDFLRYECKVTIFAKSDNFCHSEHHGEQDGSPSKRAVRMPLSSSRFLRNEVMANALPCDDLWSIFHHLWPAYHPSGRGLACMVGFMGFDGLNEINP